MQEHESRGDAGHGILRRVDIGPDGSIELEAPERVEGHVADETRTDGQREHCMKKEQHRTQPAPGCGPDVRRPAEKPRRQQEVSRHGEVHGQTMPQDGRHVCQADGLLAPAQGDEGELARQEGEEPEKSEK